MADFIAGAIKRPGAFTAKARRAKTSVSRYAQKEKGAPGKLGEEARFAIELRGFRKDKSKRYS